jgi:hypothetical protein
MAKESGLGAQLYVDEYDLSNDTNALGTISKGINLLDFTGIDKSAMERKAGQLTGSMDIETFFNPTNAHAAYATLPRADRQMSYYHRATLGAPVASMIGKQVGYDPTRAADGAYTAAVNAQSNAWWLDWGLALTAGKRTDTAATNGTGVDFALQGMPASFGLQAYLHVFAFTGTSATIKLQGSSDNGAGDAFADITGGAFTLVTAVTKERIQTSRALAVERYMRVVTTGTFSNLVFAVSAAANVTDMTI